LGREIIISLVFVNALSITILPLGPLAWQADMGMPTGDDDRGVPSHYHYDLAIALLGKIGISKIK